MQTDHLMKRQTHRRLQVRRCHAEWRKAAEVFLNTLNMVETNNDYALSSY